MELGLVHNMIDLQSEYRLTQHAWERMSGRGLSLKSIQLVLNYGRTAHIRGATINAVGRKEIEHYRLNGIDLSSVEGVQVVCTNGGSILTVYRNQDLRGLRPRLRRTRRHHVR